MAQPNFPNFSASTSVPQIPASAGQMSTSVPQMSTAQMPQFNQNPKPNSGPTVTRTVHQVDRYKKLIDLNGDMTNFEIRFSVRSKNASPYDMLVISQADLDNNPDLPYNKIAGENNEQSGVIRNENNVYQNWYLILRADQPCECEVELQKMELPKKVTPPPVLKNETNWSKVILVFGGIVAVALVLYWLSKKQDASSILSKPESGMQGMKIEPSIPAPSPSPIAQTDFLERLKKMNF